jgi:NAD(P)-dependent dehydrogenase (short-subunit alcohol dehydrogenase family)
VAARQSGYRILLGARNIECGEAAAVKLEAEGMDVRFIRIDLDDPASTTAAAKAIDERDARLDVLVNNAGVIDRANGPPGTASLAAVRRIFDVNFFGALGVTQAMLPASRRSSSARIVNVSSGLGSLARNAAPNWHFASTKILGYSASKAALNILTVQLAAELKDSGQVQSTEPGYTATDLNDHRGTQTVAEGAVSAVRLALLPDDGPTAGVFSAAGPEPW